MCVCFVRACVHSCASACACVCKLSLAINMFFMFDGSRHSRSITSTNIVVYNQSRLETKVNNKKNSSKLTLVCEEEVHYHL